MKTCDFRSRSNIYGFLFFRAFTNGLKEVETRKIPKAVYIAYRKYLDKKRKGFDNYIECIEDGNRDRIGEIIVMSVNE